MLSTGIAKQSQRLSKLVLPTNEVIFNDKDHTYTCVKTGEKLTSVTRLVHRFSHSFDPDGSILRRCAAKRGISPEDLKKEWEAKRDSAANRGTKIHASVEYYIKNKEIKKDENEDIVQEFAKIKFAGELNSEVRLWDLNYKIAGTADIIEVLDDNKINIWDLKTNEEIKKKSFFSKGKPPIMMLPPLDRFPDSNFYHFTVQLSIYGFILDKLGYWINNLAILWINPISREIEHMDVEYARKEAQSILGSLK